MLASACENIDALKFPLLATPKIDGIRCLVVNGVAMLRSMTPVPNRFIQSILGRPEFNGLDGELTVGATIQESASGVLTEEGEPDFTFNVFDLHDLPEAYFSRAQMIDFKLRGLAGTERIKVLPVEKIRTRKKLDRHLKATLKQGNEGLVLRSPNSRYKQGRATFGSMAMVKVKPTEDAEAEIVGAEEIKGGGALGALVVKNDALFPGVTFNVGTGFSDAQRVTLWNDGNLSGRTIKFRFQRIGTKDAPRSTVFIGFRSPLDMS